MSSGKSFLDKLQHSIEANSLFLPSDWVVVAASGGTDSTALLHGLHSLGYKIHAANLNHGLRPEAKLEAEYIQDLSSKLGLSCTCDTVDTTAEKTTNGGSIQEAARRLRYDFLNRVADETGASVIVTAHTKDDQVETVMLNIIRGTGISGLAGIPIRRGNIVRPMLGISRMEVEEYCAANDLRPMHDSSNDSTKYSRNEVRHKLLPYLSERFNPNVSEAILRLSEIAKDEDLKADVIATKFLENHVDNLPRARIDWLPVALQRRIIQIWLEDNCDISDLTFEHIERVRLDTSSSWILPGNKKIDFHKGVLSLDKDFPVPRSKAYEPIAVTVPGEYIYADWAITINGKVAPDISAVVRQSQHRDKMRFENGHKKLSDAFAEEKVSSKERWGQPVLVDTNSGEVLAAAKLRRVSTLTPGLKFTATRI